MKGMNDVSLMTDYSILMAVEDVRCLRSVPALQATLGWDKIRNNTNIHSLRPKPLCVICVVCGLLY